jgi:osmoprotectant transport system ATP-binding protein
MDDIGKEAEAIRFDRVAFVVAGQQILRNVSLSISSGDRVALLGRSGAGKTTLLRAVNALTSITSGTVSVLGKELAAWDLPDLRRHCGYVLQDGGLFPHMTCEQNVRLPLRLQQMPEVEQQTRAAELFHMVGLELASFGPRRPSALSGGQRQRVGVARALAANPAILLMDEPFGALDPLTRREMQAMVLDIFNRTGMTALMVTHDLEEALRLATRIVLMESGGVVVDLPVAEFSRSDEPRVRAYLEAAGDVAQ